MKKKITILFYLLFYSSFVLADMHLPIVDISSGQVSARKAFGDEDIVVSKVENLPKKENLQKKQNEVIKVAKPKVIKRGDILSPQKPTSNLWTKQYSSNNSNKEKNIVLKDETLEMVKSQKKNQNNDNEQNSLDLQISRLIELQKKAEESLKQDSIFAKNNNDKIYSSIENNKNNINIRKVYVPSIDSEKEEEKEVKDLSNIKRIENNNGYNMSSMSPSELKKAFKRTYLSENKHLSTYKVEDKFDVVSDLSKEGFSSTKDLSESSGIRPLEIKIGFLGNDSSLSRDNYNLLSEYASIVVSNPKRAVQVSIPEQLTRSLDGRKIAAKRLVIVEQVLKDIGISEQRIIPVLSQRNDDSFVLRVISSDQYETLTQQKRDMFGDQVSSKAYKSLSW